MNATQVAMAAVLAGAVLTGPLAAEAWKVDRHHTEIKFSVDHFFTPVTGRFEDFDIDLDYNEQDPSQSHITARIDVASVNTGNDRRDRHLRSADWFDAKKFPTMTFESTSVRQLGDQLVAKGNLTIKDRSQEVVLPIALLGMKEIPPSMRSMLGGAVEIASFRTATAVDRGKYGVGVGDWAATAVVGSEVQIEILLEAHLR